MGLVEITRNPSRRELSWFGASLFLLSSVLGGLSWWGLKSPGPAIGIWALGAATTTAYYAIPPIRKRIYVAWMVLSFPIGWVISHLALAIAYYLVLTPAGLALRLFRADPLQRVLDREQETYWIAHRAGTDPAQYFHQF